MNPGLPQWNAPVETHPTYPEMPQGNMPTATQPSYPEMPQGNMPTMSQPVNPGMPQVVYPGMGQPNYPSQMQPSFPNETHPSVVPNPLLQQIEQDIFNLVNKERREKGLQPVVQNDVLTEVARRKSQHMANLGYFSHTAPDGTTTQDWLTGKGYSLNAWGENIADFQANATAEEIMRGWMNSPGHRANILANNFSLLGVGVYQGNGRTFATQVFGHLD